MFSSLAEKHFLFMNQKDDTLRKLGALTENYFTEGSALISREREIVAINRVEA